MKKNFFIKIVTSFFLLLLLTAQQGCKKLVEVDLPINKTTAGSIFETTPNAIAAMTGIYIGLSSGEYLFSGMTGPIRQGVLADELTLISFDLRPQYLNALDPGDYGNWFLYSGMIYPLNALIKGFQESDKLPLHIKTILTGEAKFMRAMIYFVLVNDFGDVPMVVQTDYAVNRNIARSPKADIYNLIVSDLKDAEASLPDHFVGADLTSNTTDRVRPTKYAASAMLARVYLFLGQWDKAEAKATELITNPLFSLEPDLNNVFLTTSHEAIWQLQGNLQNSQGTNTADARIYNPLYDNPVVTLSDHVLSVFEPNDNRRTNWVTTVSRGSTDYIIPYKYKVAGNTDPFNPQPQTENTTVLRLGEQYLIRAEARARLGRISGAETAESDLNAIRNRAGLTGTGASTPAGMLDSIAKERERELFTEGHRWYDLIRTEKINDVMNVATPLKGGTWDPYKALFPIPFNEIKLNLALRGHQNPGYPEHP